jgi:hypothetical protein
MRLFFTLAALFVMQALMAFPLQLFTFKVKPTHNTADNSTQYCFPQEVKNATFIDRLQCQVPSQYRLVSTDGENQQNLSSMIDFVSDPNERKIFLDFENNKPYIRTEKHKFSLTDALKKYLIKHICSGFSNANPDNIDLNFMIDEIRISSSALCRSHRALSSFNSELILFSAINFTNWPLLEFTDFNEKHCLIFTSQANAWNSREFAVLVAKDKSTWNDLLSHFWSCLN